MVCKITSEVIYLLETLINDRMPDFKTPWIIIIARCRASNTLPNEY